MKASERVKMAYNHISHGQDIHFKYFDDSLRTSGAVIRKIGQTKVSTCYIYSYGGGWTVEGYQQECFLRYTVGYYASQSKNAVYNLLKRGRLSSYMTDADSFKIFPTDCVLSDSSSNAVIRYVNANNKPSTQNEYEVLDYEECGTPFKGQGLSSLRTSSSAKLSIKIFNDFDTSKIDYSKSQLWLEYDYPYYSEELGCSPMPSLVSCGGDSPRDQAAQ